MQKQIQIIISAIVVLALTHTVMSQRPGYAGSRPTGGLSQKDKYRPTNLIGGVNNRFGESGNGSQDVVVNTLGYGASQRPPVGAEVISPQSQYVPLPTQAPDVLIGNRFSDNSATANAVAGAVPNRPNPLDAHGDQLLIEQLSRLPVDQRPFWFLNYQAIEAQRNSTSPQFSGAVGARSSFLG